MRIKDIKLGTLLTVTILSELFLVFSMGIFTYILNINIHQQTHLLYEHPIPTRKAVGMLVNDIQLMRLCTRDLMLADTDEEEQNIIKIIEKHATDAKTQFDNIRKTYIGERNDIDEAYEAFLAWENSRQVNIQRAVSKNKTEFKDSVISSGTIGKLREIMLSKIQVIDDNALENSTKFNAKSDKLKQILSVGQIVFMLLMMILSFAFLIVFLRYFRQPLVNLTKVMQQFDKGNLSGRSNYYAKNEIGELTKSFNSLSDNLQFSSELNLKTELLSDMMLIEDDFKEFFRITLKVLMQNTEAEMAAVYLLSDDKSTFYHFLSIGIAEMARKSFSAHLLEGEFGSVLANKKIQHFKDIPDDTRFVFKTTSGNIIPKEIITIPILSSNEVVAIISLVNIHQFNELAIQLIHKIHLTYCARVDKLITYEKIKLYSESLAKQNQELEEQKRELYKQSEELSEQNRELELQKKMLDEANKLKTIFLSNMSHELRTPLNSVIALSGVLSRRLVGNISQEELSYLDVIERNGRGLLELINNILDIARIESGKDEIQITEFNLCKEIEQIVDMIKPQLINKNIEISLTGDCEVIIYSDKGKVRHIFQNLIDNGVKFTEQGEVNVHVQKMIDEVSIIVKDTGIGIEEQNIPFIFDEFRQADESTSRKYGGTGLGLSIVKKYAELIGGKISVESTPEHGSTFTLTLPISITEDYFDYKRYKAYSESNGKNQDSRLAQQNILGESSTVLLIEDNEPFIIQISDYLENSGFMVVVARNATEGLNVLDNIVPDAIILDLMMPDADGFDVLQKIRNDSRSINVPVLILTAKHITKDELRFLKQNHVYQLIQKGNVKQEELLDILREMTAVDEF